MDARGSTQRITFDVELQLVYSEYTFCFSHKKHDRPEVYRLQYESRARHVAAGRSLAGRSCLPAPPEPWHHALGLVAARCQPNVIHKTKKARNVITFGLKTVEEFRTFV